MEMSRQKDSVWFPLFITAIHLPEAGRAARTGTGEPLASPSSRGVISFFLPWVPLGKSPQKKGP